MRKPVSLLLSLILLLTACAQQPEQPTPAATATALPAASMPAPQDDSGAPTATATQALNDDLLSKLSYSSDKLHWKCDPLEIIFTVTIKDPRIKGVAFLFRMKDKSTGMVNAWSNGDDMRPAGDNMFEFIFQAKAIPSEARTKEAWLQFQFAGLNQTGQSLGHSQIFADKITYTTTCP
jgi:superfamily II RNA helicase